MTSENEEPSKVDSTYYGRNSYFGTPEADALLLQKYADSSKTFTDTPRPFLLQHVRSDSDALMSPTAACSPTTPSAVHAATRSIRVEARRTFQRLRVETGLTTLELWEQWIALAVFGIVLWQITAWWIAQGERLISREQFVVVFQNWFLKYFSFFTNTPRTTNVTR